MTGLVGYLLLFVLVGVGFIFVHLIVGKLIRPARPHPEKLTIYECGEPTIGSAWVQFDLRYYVVALLFVIFDVEVAFFFPWAVVFGSANELARVDTRSAVENRAAFTRTVQELVPTESDQAYAELTPGSMEKVVVARKEAARQFAWLAFFDIVVFFGVLLVGFAYLWRRGDINWVRSIAAERGVAVAESAPPAPPRELVAAGR